MDAFDDFFSEFILYIFCCDNEKNFFLFLSIMCFDLISMIVIGTVFIKKTGKTYVTGLKVTFIIVCITFPLAFSIILRWWIAFIITIIFSKCMWKWEKKEIVKVSNEYKSFKLSTYFAVSSSSYLLGEVVILLLNLVNR